MKPVFKAISASVFLTAAFVVPFSQSSSAKAQQVSRQAPICGDRDSLMVQLEKKYSEQPKSMGLAANGSVVEVLTANTGTWTIMITNPQGITCLIAAGEHWEEMNQRKADYTPS